MLDSERLRELELRPCPFCGGKPFSIPAGLNANFKLAKQNERAEHYDVRCQSCGASAGIRSTPEKIIEAWNRRANDDEIERLRAVQENAWQDPECFEPDIGQNYLILYGDGGDPRIDKAEYFGEGFYATRLYEDGTAAHGIDGSLLLGVMPIPQWRGVRNEEGVG